MINTALYLTYLYKRQKEKLYQEQTTYQHVREIRTTDSKSIKIYYNSLFDILINGSPFLKKRIIKLIGTESGLGSKDQPGLISLFLIRDLTLFPHRSIKNSNQIYLERRKVLRDFKIFFWFIFLCIVMKKTKYKPTSDFYNIFDIKFSNLCYQTIFPKIQSLIDSDSLKKIFFINAHCLNISFEDNEYKEILKNGDLVLPDGIGLQLACKKLGLQLKENLNGTDFFPLLLNYINTKRYSVYLLGATEPVLDNLIKYINTNFPDILIKGFHHGHLSGEENKKVCCEINQQNPTIVLVAMGVPMQEKWIHQNEKKIKASLVFAVGGLFDFYGGKNKRAPVWMRELGLEWVFRIYQEPSRMWKRYIIGNPKFLLRVNNEYKKQQYN